MVIPSKMTQTSSNGGICKEIKSFVFLDFEGTGLGSGKPRITELALVAIHRDSLQNKADKELQRVLDEMVLCVNPRKSIPHEVFRMTGNPS